MTTPQQSVADTRPPGGRTGEHPAIEFAGVNKDYFAHGESVAAVKTTDLAIGQGEFFSLLGPSGCGKTTTMRMIAGFEEPTAGKVYLAGRDVTGVPPHKRDINMVFQSYALFPHLNTFQNVAFGLERKKVAKDEIRKRTGEVLELVQLAHLAKRKPSQLSGGQAQRVALARALVNRPRALLLDEPLGALDLRLRKQLQIELKTIQRDVGITFVHVTHDQEEAMSMADTIAVMNLGKIEQAGGAADLYERPQTEFVANFLGVSNLVDAQIRRNGGGPLTKIETHDGAVLHVPSERCGPHESDTVRAGVRPEKIQLIPAGQPVPDGSNVLHGTVMVAAFLGISIQYVIRAKGGEELNVFAQNADGSEPDSLGVGREVQLAWKPEHTFVVGRG
jgi:spermidine/putrescine transport system ATP-binding protein